MRFLGALLLLGGCATQPAPCPAGFAPATIATAYFGLPPGQEADWDAFLAGTVTPAFPDGLTTLAAAGQWRNTTGVILREPSRVLLLVLPGTSLAEAARRLAPVEADWRERQGQASVLRELRSGCAAL